jgi:hypothetical protein
MTAAGNGLPSCDGGVKIALRSQHLEGTRTSTTLGCSNLYHLLSIFEEFVGYIHPLLTKEPSPRRCHADGADACLATPK